MPGCEAELPLRRCSATRTVAHSGAAGSCHPFLPLAPAIFTDRKLNTKPLFALKKGKMPVGLGEGFTLPLAAFLSFWGLQPPLAPHLLVLQLLDCFSGDEGKG